MEIFKLEYTKIFQNSESCNNITLIKNYQRGNFCVLNLTNKKLFEITMKFHKVSGLENVFIQFNGEKQSVDFLESQPINLLKIVYTSITF